MLGVYVEDFNPSQREQPEVGSQMSMNNSDLESNSDLDSASSNDNLDQQIGPRRDLFIIGGNTMRKTKGKTTT